MSKAKEDETGGTDN